MCGIVGFISPEDNISCKIFATMRDSLIHRGPDDAGIRMFHKADDQQTPTVGLAHRRLSIIDLTQAG
ncbi:MAG: hypothetical protein D3905_15795, partial [Candidatus Electrothrix sp. AS4_5]|nr:hypothetical protein [Candidatus Electrothrix gigas]